MIKAIIFDFHGVLANKFTKLSADDFCRYYKIKKSDFVLASQKASRGLDTGQKSEYQYFHDLGKSLNLKISTKEIKDFFAKADKKNIKINKEIYPLLKKLRQKYTIILLTNVSRGLAKRLRQSGFYKNFDKKFFSYKVGLEKNNKNSWKYILNNLKLNPEEIIFIDDNPNNLPTARRLGIKCILYKNKLRQKLNQYL